MKIIIGIITDIRTKNKVYFIIFQMHFYEEKQ